MQYQISGTTATIIYPVFTEVDENTLEAGGQVITSGDSGRKVDASQVSGYNTPATATTVSDVPNPQQALYQTDTNNITYSWTEGTSNPNYDYIRFVDKYSWNSAGNLKAYFYNSSSENKFVSPESQTETYSENGNDYTVYKFAIPSNTKYKNVIFTSKGINWDLDGKQTADISLVGNSTVGYGHGYEYKAKNDINGTDVDVVEPEPEETLTLNDNKLYFINFPSPGNCNNMNVNFDDSNETVASGDNGKRVLYNGNYMASYNGYSLRSVTKSSYSNYIIIYNKDGDSWTDKAKIYKSDIDAHIGYAILFENHNTSAGVRKWSYEWISLYDSQGNSYGDPVYPILSQGTSTTYTPTYQPEDRYGMISNDNSTTPVTNGTADVNNFIYISTSMSDPYIMFYDSSSNAIGGSDMATTGIKLSDVCGNTASPYKIRLPKNAASFKVSDGTGTLSSTAIQLYETVNTTVSDGGGNSTNVTMTNYHHAGTTFYLTSAGAIDTNATGGGKVLRTGYTAQKSAMTDPLTPRTGNDYIYFTDVGNNWGNTVYAYYYGGEDGEYAAWPGLKASTSDSAPLVYKDNSGHNVFMFQLPKVSDGKYPYVIFSNGSATDGSRKVTQAIRIMDAGETAYTGAGKNYSVNSSGTNQHYGTYDGTASNYVTAYPTTEATKNSTPTVSVADTGKYIYIINNGTYAFSHDCESGTRYLLDDMHVVFYDGSGSAIGSGDPGYKPDKVGDVSYR